jgi:DNA-binding XRE family transcriptional regulator
VETEKEASVIIQTDKREFRIWLSKKLIRMREKNHLEQIDVAITVKKLLPAYKAHEKADSEPSIIDFMRICKLYNITAEEFFADCPIQL